MQTQTNTSYFGYGPAEWHPFPATPTTWHEDETTAVATRTKPLDREQFGEAFRHGYPLTLRFLLSRGAAADVAEEIAQAAWAKSWECREQLRQPNMIGAWVNSIAKNMLKNRFRADQKFEVLTETVKADGVPGVSVDVNRILTRCDHRDSTILTGYYLEGYTTEEIARRLGLTPVTVRVRLLRIRRALRSQLMPAADRQAIPQAA